MKLKLKIQTWWFPPLLFFFSVLVFTCVWAICSPEVIQRTFNDRGCSTFELITLPFYFAIIPFVLIFSPFSGSKLRRLFFKFLVVIVVIMAVVKQLDLHLVMLRNVYPQFVEKSGMLAPDTFFKPNGVAITGTPFKMRVLTNAAVPFGMKAFILAYFMLLVGSFALGFAILARRFFVGVFRLEPSAWAFGSLGVSGVVVKIADRLPVLLSLQDLVENVEAKASIMSFLICLEEGEELMIAVFAFLTIYFSHCEIKKGKNLESFKLNGKSM